jgi:hypothetical protein
VYNGTDNYGGSGYDAARDWMWYQFVHERGMTDADQVFFNNKDFRPQCNNPDMSSRADGKVNVIALQPVSGQCCSLQLDMDPATPGVQSSFSVTGPQDISVDIVLGDNAGNLSGFDLSLFYDDTRLMPVAAASGGLNGNPDFNEIALSDTWNCGQGGSPSPDIDSMTGPGHGVALLSCFTTAQGATISTPTMIATLQLHVAASGTSTVTIGHAHFVRNDLTDIGACYADVSSTMTCVGGSVTAP